MNLPISLIAQHCYLQINTYKLLDYLIQLFTINTVYCFSCSLNCWNEHKTVECSTVIEKVQEKVDSELLSLYNFPTEDTVPLEKLKLLGK